MHNRLIILLDALTDNYRLLAGKAPHALCAPVIKASGYGMDAQKIMIHLAENGAKLFFLACLEEALALSDAAKEYHLELAVLGYDKIYHALYAEKKLIPVLNSFSDLMQWNQHAIALQRKLPAIIHIDTGMSRLGFSLEDCQKLQENLFLLDAIALRYVMSHFACADQENHPLTRQQYRAFCKVSASLTAPRSLANSSGIFRHKDYHFDMIRPGAALYGINPTPEKPNPMKHIIELKCPIRQIRTLKKGDSVGYGASWVAQKETRIAVVGIGYADGYHRAASNRAQGRIKNRLVDQIGTISMDSTIFDISGIDSVHEGMDIALLDGVYGVDALADAASTVTNEVLTSLGNGKRVIRLYQ